MNNAQNQNDATKQESTANNCYAATFTKTKQTSEDSWKSLPEIKLFSGEVDP